MTQLALSTGVSVTLSADDVSASDLSRGGVVTSACTGTGTWHLRIPRAVNVSAPFSVTRILLSVLQCHSRLKLSISLSIFLAKCFMAILLYFMIIKSYGLITCELSLYVIVMRCR